MSIVEEWTSTSHVNRVDKYAGQWRMYCGVEERNVGTGTPVTSYSFCMFQFNNIRPAAAGVVSFKTAYVNSAYQAVNIPRPMGAGCRHTQGVGRGSGVVVMDVLVVASILDANRSWVHNIFII